MTWAQKSVALLLPYSISYNSHKFARVQEKGNYTPFLVVGISGILQAIL